MTTPSSFRLAEHAALAISDLADFAHALDYDGVPQPVRARLQLALLDLFGVTEAGAATPELTALLASWPTPAGEVLVPGTEVLTTAEASGHLAAVAACVLELDEGNKHAAGHPAAHVVFAAVTAAHQATEPVSGERFLAAVVAGYEVAARFGRATRRDPAWHTHGHWGATGAACAAALLLGGSPGQVAAAIDAATGLMHVAPWGTVLAGDFTRNLWIAGANRAGLDAARLALAGLAENLGSAQHSLGGLVGALDPDVLTAGLGEEWLMVGGYLKRHAACSYTHPAVDLVQALRAAHPWDPQDVRRVVVSTHSLSGPLLARHPRNRLAAMFSLPFVVSTAVVSGRVDPATMQPGTPAFEAAEELSDRVEVRVSEHLDALLPSRRCAEVAVHLQDGTVLSLGAPNPVGDGDHFPLGDGEVRDKLDELVGRDARQRLATLVLALPRATDVASLLATWDARGVRSGAGDG